MAIQAFVTEHLGQRYIEPPPFDLGTCFKESAPVTPLIFVLSSGETSTHLRELMIFRVQSPPCAVKPS